MRKRDTIVRYSAPERINHWITAFCFVLASVSGLGFFFPSFNWLMNIGHAAAGAHSSSVCRRGDVCLVYNHVFPLLAPQPHQ